MLSFFVEKIPDVIGYLVLTEDGAVLSSGGELENDERSANIITGLIQLTDNFDSSQFSNNSCQRICIAYEEHSYVLCLSNKKVYVVKKKNPKNQQTHQQQQQHQQQQLLQQQQMQQAQSQSQSFENSLFD